MTAIRFFGAGIPLVVGGMVGDLYVRSKKGLSVERVEGRVKEKRREGKERYRRGRFIRMF